MLKIPAYLTGFSSRADNSAGVRFATQEIDGATFSLLKDLNGSFGYLLFSPNPISEKDIPSEVPEEGGKSISQRIRGALFVYFKQNKIEGDFEVWRRKELEKYLQSIKEKLNNEI